MRIALFVLFFFVSMSLTANAADETAAKKPAIKKKAAAAPDSDPFMARDRQLVPGNLVPFKGQTPRRPAPTEMASTCELPGVKLPKEAVVLATGAYAGRELGKQIDQSGHEATQFDVTVNADKPVVLVLGAYEPSIWNIGWTKGTEILAVIVSGYHRQAVAGLHTSTPVLNASYDNKSPCGYFYVAQDQLPQMNALTKKVFGLEVRTVFNAANGVSLVGLPLKEKQAVLTNDAVKVESFFDSKAPLAGRPGLEAGVKEGQLRLATPDDLAAVDKAFAEEYKEKHGNDTQLVGFPNGGAPKPRLHGAQGTYTVLKQFTIPAGLYGGNSAAFIVLKGVPSPEGDPGHSMVYDLNKKPVCQGPICQMFNQ